MICKECIHFDVCEALESNGISKVYPSQCGCYKPKSRFIELPCEVGDVLYDVYDAISNGDDRIREYKVSAICINLDKRNKPCIIISGCYFAFEDFGKTVYLTKEEAEKALAEREKK